MKVRGTVAPHMPIAVPEPGIGRALTCRRCDFNSTTPRGETSCSCLIHCGADGCTGTPQPRIDKPTQHRGPYERGGQIAGGTTK